MTDKELKIEIKKFIDEYYSVVIKTNDNVVIDDYRSRLKDFYESNIIPAEIDRLFISLRVTSSHVLTNVFFVPL